MGTLPLKMDAKLRLEAQELAKQAAERRLNATDDDEDAMYSMSMDDLAAKARGWK